jgi:hypothetical protein
MAWRRIRETSALILVAVGTITSTTLTGYGQLATLPLARTALVPIGTVVGAFDNGVLYRLVATSGEVVLFLRNPRGLEFTEPLQIWVAFHGRDRKLLDVFASDRVEFTQETETKVGPLSGGRLPAGAASYELLVWTFSGAPVLYQSIYFTMQSPPLGPLLVQETDQFTISFAILPEQIGFELTNRSGRPIIIIWDECAFVDQAGRSHRVIHEGVRLLEKDKALVPTLVPPGAFIRDLFYPASYATPGSSLQRPLYGQFSTTPFTLGLFVTLEIGGKKQALNYRFAAVKDWPDQIKALLTP